MYLYAGTRHAVQHIGSCSQTVDWSPGVVYAYLVLQYDAPGIIPALAAQL